MKRIKKFLRDRGENERGAAFVLTAVSMVVLLWAGATGVDVGFTVYGSRQAQAMADTAALDLARYISYADTLNSISAVHDYLNDKLANVDTDNASNAALSVVPGYYANGTFTVDGYQGGGCKPTATTPGCNAIKVTANQTVPQIFFGGFNTLNGHANGFGSSTVLYGPEGSFSIGSYLVSLNTQQSAVLNAILGNTLGTNVNLTAVGYQGLANANLTLAQLISASGNLLSPTNIMTAQLTAAQWQGIYLNAVGTVEGNGSSAYTALQTLIFSNSTSTQVKLCQMLNVDTNGTQVNCTNPSIPTQALSASVNVFQMLTTEAELANGTNAINITSALNLSSPLGTIGAVTLSLQVIEPQQDASGAVGSYTSSAQCPAPSGQTSTCAYTAQVKATVNVNLLSLLGISLGTLSIPLSAASGTATLANLTCQNGAMTSTQINGSTNALTAAVTLGGNQVASLSINGVNNQAATYAGSVVPQTAATASAGTNPVTIGTVPTFSYSGMSPLLNTFVSSLLTPTSALSTALGPALSAAGVQIAGAQIADFLPNCNAIQLVS